MHPKNDVMHPLFHDSTRYCPTKTYPIITTAHHPTCPRQLSTNYHFELITSQYSRQTLSLMANHSLTLSTSRDS